MIQVKVLQEANYRGTESKNKAEPVVHCSCHTDKLLVERFVSMESMIFLRFREPWNGLGIKLDGGVISSPSQRDTARFLAKTTVHACKKEATGASLVLKVIDRSATPRPPQSKAVPGYHFVETSLSGRGAEYA